MVMVNPSYSFPGSFKLGTLELTVKPSLVLLLNCFRKYRHTRTDDTMQGGTPLFYSNTVASNSKSINAASRKKIHVKLDTELNSASIRHWWYRTRSMKKNCLERNIPTSVVFLTFIIGSRSSTLFTFSRAWRTSSRPLGLYALPKTATTISSK